MADDVAKRDNNYRVTMMGVTDDVNAFLKNILVDPTTGRIKVSAVVSAIDAEKIQGIDVDDTDIADGKVLVYNSTSGNLEYETMGSGEANTASNVGTAGVGVFKQKDGVDLEFKKLNAGSGKISVTDDVGNNEVDIDLGSVASTDLTDSADLYKSGGTDVAVTDGGTGASTAADARTNLGLVIGTDVLAQQTIGIADNNLVEIDSATVADNDYAKFTANGLEGRSYAEVRSDLNVEDGADVTDATNVNAAGAVMESDVDAKGDIFVATADNTLTRLAVGTDDQVLTADSAEASGVKWADASGGGDIFEAYEGVVSNLFVSQLNLFNTTQVTQTINGSGLITPYLSACRLRGGNSAGNYTTIITNDSGGYFSWAGNAEFVCCFFMYATTSQDIFFGFDKSGGGVFSSGVVVDATCTDEHVGFYIENGTVYASNANGTTQTKTDISGAITWTSSHTFKVVKTGTTSIDFVVDASTLATHTTNIPTTGDFTWGVGVETQTTARDIIISNPIIGMD